MNKIFIILSLLTLIACGKEVTFDKATQESYSHVTEAPPALVEKQGTFVKKSTINDSTLTVSGTTYPLSEYSSGQALNFYTSKSLNSSTPVKFRGEVKNNKMVIETIYQL